MRSYAALSEQLKRLQSFEFMDINSILFGPDGRLRSGWRFGIFAFGFFVIFLALLTISTIVFISAGGVPGSPLYLAVFNVSILIPALLVGWLCNRFFDGLPFRALGASFVPGWFKRFSIGLAVGSVSLCIAVLIAVSFGALSFTTDPVEWSLIGRTLILSFLVFVIAAAAEEALSRGYPMQTFFYSDLKIFGIVFMALIFAAGHWGNPNASVFSWLNTFLAGIWFRIAYWKSGDLWFPFGMHLMWNWMQGAFFGIEVSGLTDITAAPLFKEIDRGPAWLTGETYGIEAGVVCTIAIILSTLAIYFYPVKESPQQ
jgi:membrane protease YdiL (CAAX protease family)